MFLFCLVFALSFCASVYMCFVVTCWERTDLLVCHFPIGILGQVWYLIVSIPDLCTLTYFACKLSSALKAMFCLIVLFRRITTTITARNV